MIFFLLFSKSVNASSRKTDRLLIYLCTALAFAGILFCIVRIFCRIEQLYVQMGSQIELSISFCSNEILFFLFLLFLLYLPSGLGGEAVGMIRKDLDEAEIAFQTWIIEKEKGKRRFVFKRVFGSWGATLLAALAVVALLIAFPRWANMIITLVIFSLIMTGIAFAIALGVWHLNIKYQDEVLRVIRQR